MDFRLDRITRMIRDGNEWLCSSRYTVLDITTPIINPLSPIVNRLLYEQFVLAHYDQPSIVSFWGYTSWKPSTYGSDKWCGWNILCRLLGTKQKRKVLGIDTIFDETYVYTDADMAYKQYWRFDWYVNALLLSQSNCNVG